MQRRAALATLAASVIPLSGCGGEGGPETESSGSDLSSTETQAHGNDRTTTDTDRETPMESGIPRTISLTEQSSAALRESFEIEAQVSVIEPEISATHTARIQITLENRSTEAQTLSYTRDTCDLNLISGRYQQDEQISLLLISAEQTWERTEADCWVPDRRNLNCGIPTTEHQITIVPDEPFHWTFRLWAAPENDTVCMPLGRCQFTRVLRQAGTEASLSFTLSVGSR